MHSRSSNCVPREPHCIVLRVSFYFQHSRPLLSPQASTDAKQEKDYKLEDDGEDAAAISFYASGFRGASLDASSKEAPGADESTLDDVVAPPAGPAGSSGLSMYLNAARAADGGDDDTSWMPTAAGAGSSSKSDDQNRQKAVDESMEMYRAQQAERRRKARGGGGEESGGGGGWRSRRYN